MWKKRMPAGFMVGGVSRREFLEKAGAAAASLTILGPRLARGSQVERKVSLGIIGCGGRGTWIADLFERHGGYRIAAAADYFPERVESFGTKFSLPGSKLFSGLSGYKRLLDSDVDAIAVESPPFFHPEQVAAGVEAGVHVYLAKPVAVDVPGCRSIAESAQRATAKRRCFLVDFQTRATSPFIEAVKRIHEGGIGKLVFGEATYHADCPFEQWYDLLSNDPENPEGRLRAWGLDRALSGDMITEQNIHTLDVMNWIMEEPPLWAVGSGGLTARPMIGTCWDHFVVYYQYANSVAVQFTGRQFKGHGTQEGIRNRMFGSKGVLETEYGGNVLIRGDNFYRGGATADIYEAGVLHNIASFHRSIAGGDYANRTAAPSVQSNLVTILGRKAAYENRLVTWEELLKDTEVLTPNLAGLKD